MRWLAILLLVVSAASVEAQEPKPPPLEPEPEPQVEAGAPVPPDLWIDRMMRRNWDAGVDRTFISAAVDVGYLYLRPRISLGYGRPFVKWLGVDLNPIVSSNYIGFYGGVRAEIPNLSFRAGWRETASYYRTFYDKMDHYDRIAFEVADNDKAVIGVAEGELEGHVRVGPGDIIGLLSLSYVSSVEAGKNVFEESLRVILTPPWVVRGRTGYVLRWGSQNQHSVGLVGEVFGIPNRTEGIIVRAGLLVRIVLSRRVEVRGSFVPTWVSPDTIGLAGSDFTELGLRWRWASE